MPRRKIPRSALDNARTTAKRRKGSLGDKQTLAVSTPEQKVNNDYTVSWICAISTEYIAAQALVDQRHGQPQYVAANDNNDYTLRSIGKHHVVIASLPDGEYGTSSPATVIGNMLCSFHNIRISLIIGIGGGAPSQKHDVRLGDIVVSSPRGG
jgi:nucleoside phosphorylase